MIMMCADCRRPATRLAPSEVARRARLPYCRDCGPRKGTPLPAIGEGMVRGLELIWGTEGCTKLHVATQLAGPNSHAYGYRVVDRLIAADLVTARREGRGYKLVATALGRAALGQFPLDL